MTSPRVDEAMSVVDRALFLPASGHSPSVDAPIPIGHGQTNSQPRTVAFMLDLLDVHPGHRVLDVGSGSGWTTALLAHLVGPEGSVTGVELVPELTAFGQENLARLDLPQARIVQADPDRLGLAARAPFDRILCSAEPATLPQALVDQLGSPGVLVLPVDGAMTIVTKDAQGATSTEQQGAFRFVPLVTGGRRCQQPGGRGGSAR